jgi:hypothetical protein
MVAYHHIKDDFHTHYITGISYPLLSPNSVFIVKLEKYERLYYHFYNEYLQLYMRHNFNSSRLGAKQ